MEALLKLATSPFNGNTDDLFYSLQRGLDVNNPDLLLLINAVIFNDDLLYIRELIKDGININQVNANARNALFYACAKGDLELVELLIKYGININQIDINGDNALMYMCKSNLENLNLNANDVDLVGKSLVTYKNAEELSELAEQDRAVIADLLIKSGINVHHYNEEDQNVLDVAVKYAEEGIVKAIAKRGIQLHTQENPFVGIQKIKFARRKYIIKRCQNKK